MAGGHRGLGRPGAKEGPLDRGALPQQPAGNPVSYAALVTVRGKARRAPAEGIHPSLKALTRTGTGGVLLQGCKRRWHMPNCGATFVSIRLALGDCGSWLHPCECRPQWSPGDSRRPQDTAVPPRGGCLGLPPRSPTGSPECPVTQASVPLPGERTPDSYLSGDGRLMTRQGSCWTLGLGR